MPRFSPRSLTGIIGESFRRRLRSAISLSPKGALVALILIAAPESAAQGGFLEDLFGFTFDRAVPQHTYGERWGSRHYDWRHFGRHFHDARHARQRASVAREEPSPVPADVTERSVCVRRCDGFFFLAPNASSGRSAAHQATCASVCPDAAAKLFTMPPGSDNIADAKAEDGELYTQFLAKLAARPDKPKSCSCHVIADDATETKAVLNDPTLEPGDAVVTAEGVKVFRGGSLPYRKGAFLSLAQTPNLSPSTRSALAAIDRAIRAPAGRAFPIKPEKRRERSASELTQQQPASTR